MLITILILALIASGGLALTYLIADDEPMLWRVSAGSIIGSALFGVVAFVTACVVGFSMVTIIGSLIVTMLPLVLLRRSDIRAKFDHDWAKAKGTVAGANLKKMRRFAYYAFFFVVFWLFFDRTVYEMADGIYTGGSQNLGDLPFHLGAIFSFTEGNNFPPLNPSFAGAKFSYPFMSDFLTACLIKLGAGFKTAICVQNVAWAFALLVVLERFVVRLTSNKLAGRIAPALLFFSGGLGFIWFFYDASGVTKGFWDFLWQLPQDYTIGEKFRWGNSMVVLFITQRGLLLGMPLTIIVLSQLWKIFNAENGEENRSPRVLLTSAPFLVGLLAGTLPLIHVHSLAVLFIVTAFLFAIRPQKWLDWVMFGIGVVVVAVPELVWTMTGSASDTAKFFGWHFGWDKRTDGFLWFWFKNTGIFIPVLIAGLVFYALHGREKASFESSEEQPQKPAKKEKAKKKDEPAVLSRPQIVALLLFYIPFGVLFVLSNVIKMAPWEWDNIKVLIYWFVGSIPIVALIIAWGWENIQPIKIAAGVCFVVIVFAGALDVWRTMSGYVKTRVFDADAVEIAEQIKKRTPPNAMFLNAPTYNSAVVLSGRPSVMRYSGHLSSYGIDYGPREADVRRIYEGGGVAGVNLQKYNVEYVLVSPEEKNSLKANEEFFKKYTVIAESGAYKVYKVK